VTAIIRRATRYFEPTAGGRPGSGTRVADGTEFRDAVDGGASAPVVVESAEFLEQLLEARISAPLSPHCVPVKTTHQRGGSLLEKRQRFLEAAQRTEDEAAIEIFPGPPRQHSFRMRDRLGFVAGAAQHPNGITVRLPARLPFRQLGHDARRLDGLGNPVKRLPDDGLIRAVREVDFLVQRLRLLVYLEGVVETLGPGEMPCLALKVDEPEGLEGAGAIVSPQRVRQAALAGQGERVPGVEDGRVGIELQRLAKMVFGRPEPALQPGDETERGVALGERAVQFERTARRDPRARYRRRYRSGR
jgi:hypothetical protein